MKVIPFKQPKNNDIEELQEFLAKEDVKAFAFVGLHADGTVVNLVSSSSVIEMCGMLAFLEKDIKDLIEV
jgi:hypothetical protein